MYFFLTFFTALTASGCGPTAMMDKPAPGRGPSTLVGTENRDRVTPCAHGCIVTHPEVCYRSMNDDLIDIDTILPSARHQDSARERARELEGGQADPGREGDAREAGQADRETGTGGEGARELEGGQAGPQREGDAREGGQAERETGTSGKGARESPLGLV